MMYTIMIIKKGLKMNLLESRPEKVTEVLTSINYWDKKNLLIFLDKFIQNNCDKVSFVLSNWKIQETLDDCSERELKTMIINLLQNAKESDNIII